MKSKQHSMNDTGNMDKWSSTSQYDSKVVYKFKQIQLCSWTKASVDKVAQVGQVENKVVNNMMKFMQC